MKTPDEKHTCLDWDPTVTFTPRTYLNRLAELKANILS